MLNVENLCLHYGGSQILYDVSMQAQAGQVTCVMGTNGVGKALFQPILSASTAMAFRRSLEALEANKQQQQTNVGKHSAK